MTPSQLRTQLALPIVVAPMFLVSGPDLVIASCKAGLLGTLPAQNARTAADLEAWLTRIDAELAAERAARPDALIGPYGINVIVRHVGTERYEADMALLRRFRCPVVITSVGDPGGIAELVHDYGGLVFHDVASVRHAEKAIAAGVDGLIVLSAGAGGHTGIYNPFALVPQIRQMWDGLILLASAITDGASIHAAQVLGADLAYMGTRFAATQESLAPPGYKALLVSQQTTDVIITDRISGLNATFMRGSIAAAGLDPDNLPPPKARFQPDLPEGIKAWRDVWSGGHGVGMIHDIPTVAELAARLAGEYEASRRRG